LAPRPSASRISLWAPVIAYMAMIFGLSSLSTLPSPPEGFSFYDVHIAVYLGLSVLTTRALARGVRDVVWTAVLGAIVISTLYGVSDEYHQLFVPGRSFDYFDMLADFVGATAGACGTGAWSIIKQRF
jgi:VanZ family protein